MNLNDCINRLPMVLRGRFSSSNNASWFAWAADAIAKIERASVGPGNKRTVLGWQMPSGYVPMPSSLCQITNAWLDGEPIKGLAAKEDRGFMLSETADTERLSGTIKASEFTATVILDAEGKSFPSRRMVSIPHFDGATKSGSFLLESGDPLPIGIDLLKGWVLLIDGEYIDIYSSASSEDSASFHAYAVTDTVVTGVSGASLFGFNEGALDGCEFHSDCDVVEIQSAEWATPKFTQSGPTTFLQFEADRARPGRTFDTSSGYLVRGNLKIEGYRRLARPKTLTEELDLPRGTETLMAYYLRWAAENDQDPGSTEAARMLQLFEKSLAEYIVDQSNSDGSTRPTAYQFSPRLGARRSG